MKRIFATLTLALGIFLGSFAQSSPNAVKLVDFNSQTDTISVMETQIWNIDGQVGDTTSLVEYFYAGQKEKMNAYSEDSLLIDGSTTLFLNPWGLGTVTNRSNTVTRGFNILNIEGIYRLTDSTSGFWYNNGNSRDKYSTTITLDSLNTLINAK